MNRQELLYLVLGITALFELTVSPLESHSPDLTEFAMYAAAAGTLGTIAALIVGLRNFSHESNAANWANLFAIAGTPVVVGLLLTLSGQQPNVHGVSLPSLFLDFAISALCALILLIRLTVCALSK